MTTKATPKPRAKTCAERSAALAAKHRAAGLKRFGYWLTPAQNEAVKLFIEKMKNS